MRKTINISALLLGVIVFIGVSAIGYIALDYRNERREHSESIGRESHHIEAVTQEYFDKYISILRTLSESPCIKEKKGARCDEVLKTLNGRFPGVVNFAALDREGVFFASGLPFDRANPPSIWKLEFFGDLQRGADVYIMNPHMGPISDVKVSGIIIKLFGLSGNPDGFAGVSIRFSELESLWRKSAETFNHSIMIADRATLVHFASPPLIKLIGKKLPEIGLSGLAGSGGPGEVSIDSNRYTVYIRELKHSGLTIIELAPLYTFTGVYAEAHPQVLHLGVALFIAFIVSLAFVGQSRKLAVKLSMAEKESYRLMEMISHSQFALAASNAENNTIEMANEAFAALYGYSPEELRNKSVLHLFAPDSHEDLAKAIAIIHEKGFHSFQSIHLRKDGTRFPAEVYATAIRDERGKVVNRIVTVQDITERKQTEDALKRSEEKFNKAFHNSPDAITITRASDELLMDVNAALLRLSGYAREEVIGKTSVALDLWVSVEDRNRYVSTLREEGRVVDFEADFRIKSGETRRCLLSGEMYEVGGEKLILGIIRDITERKRVDKALQYNEHLLRETGRIAKIGGWEFDPVTGKGTWTEEVSRIHDLDPDEETNLERGMSFYQGESRMKINKAIKEAIELGKPYDLELELDTAKGTHKWVRTIGQPRIEDGKVVHVRGSFQDITERKRDEETLKKSEALLHETQQITKVGGWEYDIETRKLTWTDQVYKIHELPPDYDPNDIESDIEFYEPEARKIIEKAFYNAVEKGEPYDLELPFTTAKGNHLYVRTIGKAELRDGKPVRVFGNIQDITEMKTAQEEINQLTAGLEQKVQERTIELKESQSALLNMVDDLNRKTEELASANVKLQELDRLKSMFIASMSHELRTPMNSIIGFTGIILMGMSGPISDTQKKQLGMVRNSANHLLALINDVIDVSKIETGKVEMDIEGFDLSVLAREVMESFAVTASDKGLRLDLKVDEEVSVRSDRRRVRQIMVNLVGNAVKFTEAGAVAILVSETETGVEIKVRDTGIGMNPEDMERLFEAFSRIHIQGRPVVEGTGLGLYLSRRIAALLGGEITATSEFGRGSEFTVSLPRTYPEEKG